MGADELDSFGAVDGRPGLRPGANGEGANNRRDIFDSGIQMVGSMVWTGTQTWLTITAGNRFIWLSQGFNYSSRLLSIATKVVVNQICFTPVFNTYFFGMQAALAGENIGAVWERIKLTVPVSFVNSWKLWPAVTAFSFAFVPLEYRSLFSGFIAIGWYVESPSFETLPSCKITGDAWNGVTPNPSFDGESLTPDHRQTYLSYLNRLAEDAESAGQVDSTPAPPSVVKMAA